MLLVALLLALAQPALAEEPHRSPSECNLRSADGCLCVDEDRVMEWRAKAMAWDEQAQSPPVICIEDEGTGSKTLWAAITAATVLMLEAFRAAVN